MDYLKKILDIDVAYPDRVLPPLPNYIHARYTVREALLDGNKVAFVYPIGELEPINNVQKHLRRIKETMNAPAVLIPEHLTYRQKEYLLRDRLPFIVEGKQIYLPFMAVYLQDRSDSETVPTTVVLPSAQLLLLYYIYHGCGELETSDAARALSLTPTSISRASRQLVELGMLRSEKRGVQKILLSEQNPREFFEYVKPRLPNPVKRIVYVPKKEIKTSLLLSRYSALSEYSMLNPPSVDYCASASITKWNKVSSIRLQNSDDQCAVELWRYDPKKLTGGEYVDRLSLALALGDDRDERTENAVQEMLKQTWRDIDGTRN